MYHRHDVCPYIYGAWLYMDDFVYFVAKYEWFHDKSLINNFLSPIQYIGQLVRKRLVYKLG